MPSSFPTLRHSYGQSPPKAYPEKRFLNLLPEPTTQPKLVMRCLNLSRIEQRKWAEPKGRLPKFSGAQCRPQYSHNRSRLVSDFTLLNTSIGTGRHGPDSNDSSELYQYTDNITPFPKKEEPWHALPHVLGLR